MREKFSHFLKVAYDGSSYFGWQATPEGPTIQSTLNKALAQLAQKPCLTEAASRTDRGVHARGQIVGVQFPREIESSKFLLGLNALLPATIRVMEAYIPNPLELHPTLDVVSKSYRYRIALGRAPYPDQRNHCWHVPYVLDVEAMKRAASQFIGTHDFYSFCNQAQLTIKGDTFRTLEQVSIEYKEPNELEMIVKGNSFLYKMVRNIVGTLVMIGRGKLQPNDIVHFLSAKDRRLIGVTAPAHGLFLESVAYT